MSVTWLVKDVDAGTTTVNSVAIESFKALPNVLEIYLVALSKLTEMISYIVAVKNFPTPPVTVAVAAGQ